MDLHEQYISDKNALNTWGDDSEAKALERQLASIEAQYKAGQIAFEHYQEKYHEVALNIYKSQKDSLDDILDLTKQMIKQENEDAIEALEKQIDRYREIIEQKKKILELTEAARSYDMEVDTKTSDIADLQSQIDALALDDSRDAQVKRAALMEELAEKQKDLTEYQHDHSVDMQQDALDAELEAYEKEKNAEIEELRAKLDTEGKLYREAMNRINNNYDTLLKDLIDYNNEYGTCIEDDVLKPWNNVLDVMNEVISTQGKMDFSAVYDSAKDTAAGRVEDSTGVTALVSQMRIKANEATALHDSGVSWSDPRIKALNSENQDLARRIEELTQQSVTYDGHTGKWYINGQDLFAKYHTGGVVASQPNLKQDEIMAILQKGEIVFNRDDQSTLYDLLTGVKTIHSLAASARTTSGDVLGQLGVDQTNMQSARSVNVGTGDIAIDASVVFNGETSQDVLAELRKYPRTVANIVSKELLDAGIITSRSKTTLQ